MDATPSRAPGDFAPAAPPGDDQRVTPLMEQYVEIKAANPDCLLFYRMGDFYELFFEDAEVASRALGIVLTKRGKHRGQDIPMCGVPVHRADEYLHRLIAQGHRVAVCEQTEDPAEAKKRGAKSVVQRNVIRLVTAGTLTEDSLLDAKRNNYLVAVARAKRSSTDADSAFALAYLDISTGEFRISTCDRNGLPAEIARLEPGEIIVSDTLYDDPELAPLWRSLPAVTPLPRDVFDGASAERRLAAAPDLARARARLVVGRGGPRALAAIRDGLHAAAELSERLAAAPQVAEIADAVISLRRPDPAIAAESSTALGDDLPLLRRDGGFIGAHYDETLDETRSLRDESRRVVAALQAASAGQAQITTLK